jgi:membrane protease YdiL (CAAX protease family)
LPAALRIYLPGYPVFPILWPVALVCLAWLWQKKDFKRASLWSLNVNKKIVWLVLARFAFFALLIGSLVAWQAPGQLFYLVHVHPLLWLIIIFLYPVLSVYPQGIIYRGFIFERYRALFRAPWIMSVASACAFAMTHLVFGNILAVGLSLAGGMMFAITYRQTGSVMFSSMEHALYGCFLFTIGLGEYFYHGR